MTGPEDHLLTGPPSRLSPRQINAACSKLLNFYHQISHPSFLPQLYEKHRLHLPKCHYNSLSFPSILLTLTSVPTVSNCNYSAPVSSSLEDDYSSTPKSCLLHGTSLVVAMVVGRMRIMVVTVVVVIMRMTRGSSSGGNGGDGQ